MKNERGQIVVMFVLMLPIFAAIISLLVGVFFVFDATTRLQIASDRGAFSGAARLSFLMNEIAASNWKIRKGFLDVEKDFSTNSQGGDECKKRVRELREMQSSELERIDVLLASAYFEAFSIASDVVSANLPDNGSIFGLELTPLFGSPATRPIAVQDRGDIEQQRADINCDKIEGMVLDPSSNEGTVEKELLKFLISDGSPFAVALEARAKIKIPLFAELFPPIEASVTSAAAPVGGDLREFAFIDAASLSDAKDAAYEDQNGPYYRPVMVPSELFTESAGDDL